jgi:anti-sigma factor RsiW
MDLQAPRGQMSWITRKPYGCAETRKRLWEYLDDELPKTEADRVGRHLAGCRQCRPYALFEWRLLKRIAALKPDNRDVAELRDRITGMLAVHHPSDD